MQPSNIFKTSLAVLLLAAVAIFGAIGMAVGPAGIIALAGTGIAVNAANLDLVFKGFKNDFNMGYLGLRDIAKDRAKAIYMKTMSTTKAEVYGWLKDLGGPREWIGSRVAKSLEASGFEILNKNFEDSYAVSRNSIEDDTYGIYAPMMQQIGQNAAQFVDVKAFEVLKQSNSLICWDGQFLCDTDHPYVDAAGVTQTQSNWGGGSGDYWFLIDTRHVVKPVVVQQRKDFAFTMLTRDTDPGVYEKNEFNFGSDARFGFAPGFWQLIYGSRQTLNEANYTAARAAMQNFKRDGGGSLSVMPDLLVVSPNQERAARSIVKSALINSGESNPWAGTAEILSVPELA